MYSRIILSTRSTCHVLVLSTRVRTVCSIYRDSTHVHTTQYSSGWINTLVLEHVKGTNYKMLFKNSQTYFFVFLLDAQNSKCQQN